MATFYKNAKVDLTTTGATVLYTTPEVKTAVFRSILVADDSGSTSTITLTLTDSAAAVFVLYNVKATTANGTVELLTQPLVVLESEILKVTYLVHAAEGETVIPAEILLANPQLKADLFRQMQMMGIKNPNRYVVGSALNSLNPVTGQPEFFFKKIFKAFKSVLPIIGQAVVNRIAPGLGGIGTLLGSKLKGDSWSDAAKYAGIGTLSDIAYQGFNRPEGVGFFEGLKTAAARPFQAARGLFSTDMSNPLAQGMFGQYLPGKLGEAATQFRQSFPGTDFYPGYRTSEEIFEARPYTPADFASRGAEKRFQGQKVADLEAHDLFNPEDFGGSKEAVSDWQQQRADIQASQFQPTPSTGRLSLSPSSSIPFKRLAADVLIPTVGAALLGDDDEGEISGGEAREIGDPEYADYLRYRSAPPGSEREQARRAAGITPSIGARRLAESTGISLQEAQAYLESMYGEDANWRNVAGGGEIMGAGTGTSDSIPARLSDGEFVMTADAVRGAGNGSRDLGAARMYDLMSQFEGAR
jgi:hypothetical protein